jgi:hypothetical protein
MATAETHDRPTPRFTWRSLAGLFEEAWYREQRRRRGWLLAIVLLVAAGLFTAVLIGGGGNGSTHPMAVAALRSHAPGSSSSVDSRFALFNQPPASNQEVRRSTRNYPGLGNWLTSKSGFGLSRPATYIVHTSGGTVWIVTGRASASQPHHGPTARVAGTQACMVIPDHVGSSGAHSLCGGLMDGSNTMTGTTLGPPRAAGTWYGLVPNSVKRVVIRYASGPKTTVPVVNNTFLVHLRVPARQCLTPRTAKEELNLSATATTLTAYCTH